MTEIRGNHGGGSTRRRRRRCGADREETQEGNLGVGFRGVGEFGETERERSAIIFIYGLLGNRVSGQGLDQDMGQERRAWYK